MIPLIVALMMIVLGFTMYLTSQTVREMAESELRTEAHGNEQILCTSITSGISNLKPIKDVLEQIHCPFTGGHLNADTLLELDTADKFYKTDLTGVFYMGAAAGAHIRTVKFHDPHRPGKRLLGAVFDLQKLFGRRIPCPHRPVLPDDLVDTALDFH